MRFHLQTTRFDRVFGRYDLFAYAFSCHRVLCDLLYCGTTSITLRIELVRLLPFFSEAKSELPLGPDRLDTLAMRLLQVRLNCVPNLASFMFDSWQIKVKSIVAERANQLLRPYLTYKHSSGR